MGDDIPEEWANIVMCEAHVVYIANDSSAGFLIRTKNGESFRRLVVGDSLAISIRVPKKDAEAATKLVGIKLTQEGEDENV